MVRERDGEVRRVDAEVARGRVARQERHRRPELRAQQQHGRVQQRLAPAGGVVRRGELLQVGLQVAQRVRAGLAAARP